MFADQNKFPMCTAVASSQEEISGLSEKDMRGVGLVDAHAYSLIGVREIKTSAGKSERLCWVRNPWGKREWQGDWSDSSEKWDQTAKSQVPEYRNADDGCFWISFSDYDKFFYITTICFLRDDYKECSLPD